MQIGGDEPGPKGSSPALAKLRLQVQCRQECVKDVTVERPLHFHLRRNILTNCRIKSVFGGLPAQGARLMAEELFIGELDPRKIKMAIYQTKFWPEYRRDKVYTNGTSHSSSSGTTHTSASGFSTGTSQGTSFFEPNDWFAGRQTSGYTEGRSSGYSSMDTSGESDSASYGYSESVADVPILIPVPFEELSSIQYYTPEEQIIELTAALKEQFPRHCFIKIQDQSFRRSLVSSLRRRVREHYARKSSSAP